MQNFEFVMCHFDAEVESLPCEICPSEPLVVVGATTGKVRGRLRLLLVRHRHDTVSDKRKEVRLWLHVVGRVVCGCPRVVPVSSHDHTPSPSPLGEWLTQGRKVVCYCVFCSGPVSIYVTPVYDSRGLLLRVSVTKEHLFTGHRLRTVCTRLTLTPS